MSTKNLAVFDFDHTIVDDNSDTAVMKLIDRSKIPRELKNLHKSDGWTAFMQGIFELLKKNQKTENDIAQIRFLAPVQGMCELIEKLHVQHNYDIIIISDSNSYFINIWLKHHELDKYILKVFTNPARFENGLLMIKMYHLQDNCKISTKNLCKGQILEEFLNDQKEAGCNYEKIVYCGDGANDFCPILRLCERDLACARIGYKCVDLINRARRGEHCDENGVPYKVRPEVFFWNSGFDIMEHLKLI